jgi:hypothetical protein
MLILTVILFAAAALLGLFMLVSVLQRKIVALGTASIHGGLALVGVTLTWVAAYNAGYKGALFVSLILFLIAALGGATLLFAFHLKGKKLPPGLVIVHGLIAVIAFIFLLVKVIKPA